MEKVPRQLRRRQRILHGRHRGSARPVQGSRHERYRHEPRTGLPERYVREWLAGMAAASYLTYQPDTGRYSLPGCEGDGNLQSRR